MIPFGILEIFQRFGETYFFSVKDVLCVYCCSCFVCIVVILCVFVVLCVHCCFFFFTLDAGLLVRSDYSEGPATGHLDTGFSWFPCV